MENLAAEFTDHTLIIDHLQNEMRWVEVEAKIIIGMISHILRQMAGVLARLLPPGHSCTRRAWGNFRLQFSRRGLCELHNRRQILA